MISSLHAFRPLRLVAALALWGAAATAGAQTVEVMNLGPGFPTDLSADGRTAVGIKPDNGETFRWTAETGFVGLGRSEGRATGNASGLPAVSADGRVVAATIRSFDGRRGTQGRWTEATGWVELAPPLPRDGGILDHEDSSVFGMSRDGQVVTGLYWRPHHTGGSAHGSAWTADKGMVGLKTEGASARIDDANGDGHVMAGWEESPVSGIRQAVVWVQGVKTHLDTTDWPSEAERLNTKGTLVVGQAGNAEKGREEAARWDWNGATWERSLLGVLPGTTASGYSYANAVSDDGTVIGGFNRDKFSVFQTRGFLWTPATGMIEVDAWLASQGVYLRNKLTVTNVMGVSADGMSILAVGQELVPPFGTRSVLIRRLDSAATVK